MGVSMSAGTNIVIPRFDFSTALRLAPEDRMRACVGRVRERLVAEGHWDLFGMPPVPEVGATEAELERLASELGLLAPEYRTFLRLWRYLLIDDGLQVWGFDHEGVSIGRPWVSAEHEPGVEYVVFADYWRYADGDQLLLEVGGNDQQVFAYLHEHGPRIEWFAPSFSLALWRMAEE